MVSISGAVGSYQGMNNALDQVKGFGQMAENKRQFDTNDAFRQEEANAKKNQAKIEKFSNDFKSVAESLKLMRDGTYSKFGGELPPDLKVGLEQSINETIQTFKEGAQKIGLPNTTIQNMDMIRQALLAQPSPIQKATTEGAVAGTTAVAKTDALAEGFNVDRNTIAQTQGILPNDSKITQLMNQRDELLEQGNIVDAKSIQAIIDAEGSSATVDPRTLGKESSADKVKREIVDLEVNYKNIMDTGATVIGLMDEGGEGSVETAGKIAQGITGMVSSLTGVAKNFGVDVSQFESGASADERIKKADSILGKSSGISAQIRSAIVDLAYAAAAAQGQTGKAVSDKDYENNLRQLGSGSGGLKNFRGVMVSFLERNATKMKNRHEGLNSLLDVGARRQSPSFEVNFDKKVKKDFDIPEGLQDLGDGTFKMPDGTIVRRKK